MIELQRSDVLWKRLAVPRYWEKARLGLNSGGWEGG